jgi:hypothetical protein
MIKSSMSRKRSSLLLSLAIVLMVFTAPCAVAEGPTAMEKLESLSWLTGVWTGETGRGTYESRYSTASGGVLLSTNKEFADGRVVGFEFEQFRVQGDDVIMAPYPNGKQSPIVFTLTEWSPDDRKAVFTNPEHDFPQIITYQRTGDRTLKILVQAKQDGKLSGFELNLELSK